MQALAIRLKEKGLKATPQRIAIYKYLEDSKDHPSAETIYRTLRESHPTMSLATVYKTLDSLKKAGLLHQLNVGEDSFRYDADTHPHPHIQCVQCTRVFDLDPALLQNVSSEISQTTSFQVLSQQIYFYGVCPDCQSSQKEAVND